MITKKSTRDLYLAAAFMALGAKYESVDRTDLRHQVFTFSMERPDEGLGAVITAGLDLDSIEQDWINGTLTVNAIQFKDAIQRMKGVIYSSS